MAKKYIEQRRISIIKMSKFIFAVRMAYVLVLIALVFFNNINMQRPLIYLLSSMSILGAIKLDKLDPNFVVFLAPLSILSYCTFIFTNGKMYTSKEDPCHLMIGYISQTYLSASF